MVENAGHKAPTKMRALWLPQLCLPLETPVSPDQKARMDLSMRLPAPWVLASFRRLLRQKGAFLDQKSADSKDVLWWITTLHEMVATDSHIELGVEFPTRTWAMGCCSLSAQKVAVEKVLPLDYSTMLLPPVVGVCSCPNEQVAVLPLQSPILAALREEAYRH